MCVNPLCQLLEHFCVRFKILEFNQMSHFDPPYSLCFFSEHKNKFYVFLFKLIGIFKIDIASFRIFLRKNHFKLFLCTKSELNITIYGKFPSEFNSRQSFSVTIVFVSTFVQHNQFMHKIRIGTCVCVCWWQNSKRQF